MRLKIEDSALRRRVVALNFTEKFQGVVFCVAKNVEEIEVSKFRAFGKCRHREQAS